MATLDSKPPSAVGNSAMRKVAWGAARDATGGFNLGLVSLAALTLASAALTMRIRTGLRHRQETVAVSI